MMVDTDVLIAMRPCDLSHMLLLLPQSVVIAYAPNHLRHTYLHHLAEVASLFYLPVFNTTSSLPVQCTSQQERGLFQYGEECIQQLERLPITIQFGQIHNLMRVASTHVHIKKYKTMGGRNALER